MKLYVITRGEYSDYQIRAICSTEAIARQAKTLLCSENEIEEWTLDELPPHPPGLTYWEVHMDRDGNTRDNHPIPIDDVRPYPWCPTYYDKFVSYYTWAEDETHAVKIANELRTQLIASGDYTDNWGVWNKNILPRYFKGVR